MFSHYLRSVVVLFILFFAQYSHAGSWGYSSNCEDASSTACAAVMDSCNDTPSYSACHFDCNGIQCTLHRWWGGDGTEPCAEGEIIEEGTHNCVNTDCPDGMVKTGGICLPNGPTNDCENIQGYISGQEFCADAQDECEAVGGQLGQFNGDTVCVPSDYGAPECEGGSDAGLVLVDNGDGGGFVCDSPTDNENGTDNESGGPNSQGEDPDTDVETENFDDPTDPDPETITDATELNQESLAESQDQTKQLKKLTNQLGDVNDELNEQSGFLKRDEERQLDRDQGRLMRDHTVQSVATYQDALNNFYNAIGSAPATQAFQNMANIVPTTGGQCPPFSIDLTDTMIGTVASTDIHCDLLEDMAPAINAIMLVVFAWTAFRVFASS